MNETLLTKQDIAKVWEHHPMNVTYVVSLLERLWEQYEDLEERCRKMRNCENCKHKGQTWICDWCEDRDRWEFDE